MPATTARTNTEALSQETDSNFPCTQVAERYMRMRSPPSCCEDIPDGSKMATGQTASSTTARRPSQPSNNQLDASGRDSLQANHGWMEGLSKSSSDAQGPHASSWLQSIPPRSGDERYYHSSKTCVELIAFRVSDAHCCA
jgi:hypothetical protein